MKDDKIKYTFEAVNLTDYELKFKLIAKNQLMNKIFSKSKERLIRRGKHQLKGKHIDKINCFNIPVQYNNLIGTIITKQIKYVADEVKQDKIIILNSKVNFCQFERDTKNKDWQINIKVVGQYVDKN